MNRSHKILIIFLFLLSLGAAFASGYVFRSVFSPEKGSFPLLKQAYGIFLDHEYYELPEGNILEYGMVRGMIQSGRDPYAVFLEPVQHELESNTLQGNFGGIGVEVSRNSEGFVILHPIPDGPAIRAGMQDGDRLVLIEAMIVQEITPTEDIEAALRGPVGEQINLTVARPPDFSLISTHIIREEIGLPSVTWYLYPETPEIAVIKLNIFAASTSAELMDIFEQSTEAGATHFVLDLRDNGGGLLTAGIDTAKLFLEEGAIIQQQYRGRDVETYSIDHPGPYTDYPLVVLVNNATASAAEIVAGALQAHGRAEILGEPTFGKSSIQLVFDLVDGSSLHVTAAEWWIPDMDRDSIREGIQPDILLSPISLNGDEVLRTAAEYLLTH